MAVTLSDLRAAVRDRSDTEGSARVTDAKLDRVINSSIKRLYNKILECSEDEYTVQTALTTAAGVADVILPSDFLILRHVEWQPPTSPYPEPLNRFQLQERARYVRSIGWQQGSPISYRMMGRKPGTQQAYISFLPVPTGVHTVNMWYAQAPTILTNPSDTYDSRSGFEEWVIWDAAIQIMVAEESDITQAAAERERVWQTDILPIVSQSDQARPDKVIDVDSSASTYEIYGA